jgi:hypothetical protein
MRDFNVWGGDGSYIVRVDMSTYRAAAYDVTEGWDENPNYFDLVMTSGEGNEITEQEAQKIIAGQEAQAVIAA